MAQVRYKGVTYQSRPGETLLQMFLRQGVSVPYSCGGGVCHMCMHRCVEGEIPERARKGLKPELRSKGFMLLCRCVPTGDMEIELPSEQDKAASDDAVDMQEGLERAFPEPDPALWRALDDGALLARILEVFYARVFADPLLAPFFSETTERRLAEKQYNFLRQAITGEKVYFGERPRNAHHWMVISDNVFDHRADILRDVLVEFDVPPEVIDKLMAIEEYYREDIVKDRPWEKVLFGKALPLEGYEEMTLEEGSLCDGCEEPVESGAQVIYHVRTGKLYCNQCRAS